MHIYEPKNFSNLLPEISLSSEEIKQTVSSYHLSFPKEKNDEVEWKIQFPMFVDAFYDFVVSKQEIPNQEEFHNYYLEFNKQFFTELSRPDLASGLRARVFRTYPSLVRDIYFNKYIEEKIGTKCKIIYNTRLDIEEGIDLMIITNKNNYGICFFTKTPRAYVGRAAKIHRHTLFDNVKYVEIPVEFRGSVKAGDFFLYGEQEFNELYNILSR